MSKQLVSAKKMAHAFNIFQGFIKLHMFSIYFKVLLSGC